MKLNFRIKDYLEQIIHDCKQQINTLDEYLIIKGIYKDFHAVSDAANDIRELEAQIKIIRVILTRIENDQNK